ncbi:ABC transporter ATP-binding protein [Bradyrhizobium sp. GCM10027634]|uniref:ABC transporter ATP-binding protein n=1 Tax=unclassified Bradyrhizobium TaxID=2631580 RepID=UPI00188C2B3B|nr:MULTISPECIES: ABC transporter ATP-binding protein [unclassified Bradyrhizobium]MDN5005624.1 ABC transporter ATP-binding protein [Bradyrhizobium sp. WYCCWR 12677]QOZ44588.1 ABC transporter ATP-binding protein [Bradyrhizobium sp. CCBAU 53340]
MTALLELRDVSKRYRDMVVIPGLTLKVRAGEFVGVIGPNGAGKTTLFGLISGNLRCDSGAVYLDGEDVTALGADARCRAGVGRTFQIPQPFQGMTVFENALVAATFGAALHGKRAEQKAREALVRCGLERLGDTPAGRLTLLQRKRLELSRALATQPRLLLLDEVAGGLTDAEVGELLELVTAIHRAGVTVIWIEHLVHALVSSADRLLVLSEGRLLGDGAPGAVMSSREVRDVYLGSDLDEQASHAAH